MAGEELDLPNWNSALLADDAFDCAPPKQPLGQVRGAVWGAARPAWRLPP